MLFPVTMRNPVHATKILSCTSEVKELLAGRITAPRTAELLVTTDCNHRCVGCRTRTLRGGAVRHLDPDRTVELIAEFREMGVRALEISGMSEPLLYPYLTDIVSAAMKHGLAVGLMTNGARLHEVDAALLLRASRFIRVSYDSCDRGMYRKLCGADDLDTVERNIAGLVALKKRTGARTTIGMKSLLSVQNDVQIADIAERARQLGADYIQFKALRNSRTALTRVQSEAADRQINEVRGKLAKRIAVLGGTRKERLFQPCRLSPLHPVIDPDLNLFVCPYYTHHAPSHKIGSLKHKAFRDIWGTADHKRAVENIDMRICNIFDCPLIPFNNFAATSIALDEMHLDFI